VGNVTTTTTVTGLSGGSPELPIFTDGNSPYTGAINQSGSESIGFAGRITVNSGLIADPSKLVAYQASTPAGDQTRPNFIYNQLTAAAVGFSPTSGIGSDASPYVGTISSFLRQAMSQQGGAANAAQSLAQGQDLVVSSLKQRFNDSSGVNIDQEMSNLLTLQTAYGANARVFSVINDMLGTLLKM
jgi:flagellar hook-associated protein 1 FlgK